MEENEEAARIYQLCCRQVILAIRWDEGGPYSEPVDLNYPAVKVVMDLYGVARQREVFEKVRRAFFHFLK